MDAEGLRPDALDAACRTSRARVLLHARLQNPTSAIMSDSAGGRLPRWPPNTA